MSTLNLFIFICALLAWQAGAITTTSAAASGARALARHEKEVAAHSGDITLVETVPSDLKLKLMFLSHYTAWTNMITNATKTIDIDGKNYTKKYLNLN